MANTFNDVSRMWSIDTEDILTFRDHTDANSGLMPVTIKKVVLSPSATGDGAQFMTWNPGATPNLALTKASAGLVSVTSTYRITDDSGTCFNGATIGDVLHIQDSSSGNNNGWYYVTAVAGGNTYVDVEYATNALTDEDNVSYKMDFFTPEVAFILVSPSFTHPTSGTLVQSEPLDWGEQGRRFYNLASHAISTSAIIRIYLK